MGDAVRPSVEGGLATWRLSRAHGNAINGEVVDGLLSVAREAASDPGIRGAMLAAAGKLFCPGLDLVELIELDRESMRRFLERFNACLLALYTFPKPLVAAVSGPAVAGGCVLALTADWRVLREGAFVGLNEIRAGLPLPFGVATIVRESLGPTRLEEVALFGRNYADREAVSAGLVHEVHPATGFEDHCLGRLEELAAKNRRAFATTKAYLRSAAVERIRAHDAALAPEFLDAWFSPESRERLGEIVEQLRH